MIRRLLIAVLMIAVLMFESVAEQPIQIIYWQSTDISEPDIEKIESLTSVITGVQSFFATEMDRHGYGKKTFNFSPEIKIIKASYELDTYTDALTIANETSEIEFGFDNSIYVVFVGGATSFGAGGIAVSQPLCTNIPERLQYCNNLIVIPAEQEHLIHVLTAHEIGHAFNLQHPTNRLASGKIDIMYFPLHVTPDKTEYLKDYVLNAEHAKQLNTENRLFVQPDLTDEDLVCYYPFDGNVQDTSLHQNDGQTKGNITYVKGVFGDAISLENGAYVHIETSKSLSGDLFRSNTWTFMCWVYAKKRTGYGYILKGRAPAGGGDTFFVIEDTGTLSWRGYIDGEWSWGSICDTKPDVFEANTWFHVALTNDGKKLKIYVDGEVVKEANFQQTDGGNIYYRVGSHHTYAENFIGYIDDLAIFSRTLDKEEINAIKTGGVATFLNREQPLPATSDVPEDVNNDGVVDLTDVKLVRLGMSETTDYDTDINDDGITNDIDLALVKLKAIHAVIAAAPKKEKIKITSWAKMKSR